MDVALVVHDFDCNNGQGRYCVELVRHLHSRCCFTVYSNTASSTDLAGVKWCRVPAWRRRHLTAVLSFLIGVEPRLRAGRHEIVHAQGLSSWRADIVTVHMVNAARLRRLPPERWKDRCFSALVSPVERAFYRQRRIRHAIVMSRRLGKELEEEYGWDRQISVIPHGADVIRFRPARDEAERLELRARFRVPVDRWIWLFMGEAVKGLREVIDQLPAFPNAHLLVVSRSECKSHVVRAENLGVRNRITFHGFEPLPELAFRAVDAFIYPSAHDPFGLVATEAMASGLPVILGREIGAAELVRNGDDGLLVDPGSAADLRAQIGRLAGDRSHAMALGLAARTTIRRHSWEVCAEATWAKYDALREIPRLS